MPGAHSLTHSLRKASPPPPSLPTLAALKLTTPHPQQSLGIAYSGISVYTTSVISVNSVNWCNSNQVLVNGYLLFSGHVDRLSLVHGNIVPNYQ